MASKYGSIHFDKFVVLILAAVLIQSGAKILNDCFDFSSGQDKEKWHIPNKKMKPLASPQHKHLPLVATTMFIIAAFLGLWLATHSHPVIILIGFTGMYAGYKYSAGGNQSFSALGFGEVIAAIFLGIMLAFIVQNQAFGWTSFAIGFLFAILISMMILTNNIRDIRTDEGFRQTIPICMGKDLSVKLLIVLIISVYVSVTLLIISQVFPWLTLIVYLAIPIACLLIKAFNKKGNTYRRNEKYEISYATPLGIQHIVTIWFTSRFIIDV